MRSGRVSGGYIAAMRTKFCVGTLRVVVCAALLTLTGCGASPRAAQPTRLPTLAEISKVLLDLSDLPPGYVAIPIRVPGRAFCNHSVWRTAYIRVHSSFVRTDGLGTVGVKAAITAVPTPRDATAAVAAMRSLLSTSCHHDVRPGSILSLGLIPTPAFGMPSIGVRESAQLTGPYRARVPAGFRIIFDLYIVADGRYVLEVAVSGERPDLTFLRQLMLTQIARAAGKDHSGLAALANLSVTSRPR